MSGRRPFSSVWQAATMLDCSERRVYHHIQEGRLPLAFDISRPGGERSYIRMATASVMALQRHRRPPSDLDQFIQFMGFRLGSDALAGQVPAVGKIGGAGALR